VYPLAFQLDLVLSLLKTRTSYRYLSVSIQSEIHLCDLFRVPPRGWWTSALSYDSQACKSRSLPNIIEPWGKIWIVDLFHRSAVPFDTTNQTGSSRFWSTVQIYSPKKWHLIQWCKFATDHSMSNSSPGFITRHSVSSMLNWLWSATQSGGNFMYLRRHVHIPFNQSIT